MWPGLELASLFGLAPVPAIRWASALAVLALLVAVLPDAPVKLDSALAGEEAPEDASPATVPSADPGLGAQRGEALEFAVLLLLERLAPTERAAYILREAFDYPYDEIGKILKVSEANARQLVTQRAEAHRRGTSQASRRG